MGREFILDGLNLHSGDYRITNASGIFSAPPKDVKTVDLAREDGSRVVYEKYLPKDATLVGYIHTADAASADAALDVLKKYTGRKGIELKVGYGSGYRIWNIEVEALIDSRSSNDINKIPFTIRISAAYPFATDDTEATLVSSAGITTASKSIGVNNAGTYKALPVIVITVNAINPSSSDVTVSITNPSTQETISFTETLAPADVITIDSVSKLVFVNSTSVPAVGQFPTWEPDGGTFEYTDTATTRNIDIMATYAKRYL